MMQAIETIYRGYRFRSRLEARWAVFFTEIGLRWEYEPEGFHLPSGQLYLPDFRVESINGSCIWYEIKPRATNNDAKFNEFMYVREFPEEASNWRRGSLLSGDPLDWYESIETKRGNAQKTSVAELLMLYGGICPRCGELQRSFASWPMWPTDHDGGLCYDHGVYVGCGWCDYDTPTGSGNDADLGVVPPYLACEPYKGLLIVAAGEYLDLLGRMKRAAVLARQARFEHGQIGSPTEWRFA